MNLAGSSGIVNGSVGEFVMPASAPETESIALADAVPALPMLFANRSLHVGELDHPQKLTLFAIRLFEGCFLNDLFAGLFLVQIKKPCAALAEFGSLDRRASNRPALINAVETERAIHPFSYQ